MKDYRADVEDSDEELCEQRQESWRTQALDFLGGCSSKASADQAPLKRVSSKLQICSWDKQMRAMLSYGLNKFQDKSMLGNFGKDDIFEIKESDYDDEHAQLIISMGQGLCNICSYYFMVFHLRLFVLAIWDFYHRR